jgi:hypothetical protein
MSRYELQWALVLNCSVIALLAGVHAVDPEGSVFWGLFFVGLMIAQIVQATRPESPAKAAQPEADEVSGSSERGPREHGL